MIKLGNMEYDSKDHVLLEITKFKYLNIPSGEIGWWCLEARNFPELNVTDTLGAGIAGFKVPSGYQLIVKGTYFRSYTPATTITIAGMGLSALKPTEFNAGKAFDANETPPTFSARMDNEYPIFGALERIAKAGQYSVGNGMDYSDYNFVGQPYTIPVVVGSPLEPIIFEEGQFPCYYMHAQFGIWDGFNSAGIVGQLVKKV